MLEDDDEDDPFSRNFDDNASIGSASKSATEGSEDDGDPGPEGMSDAYTSDMDVAKPQPAPAVTDRAALLKEIAKDQSSVAASLALSTKGDIEKGRAVKKQKTAFDSLLSSRVKLQKSLVATNTLVAQSSADLTEQLGQASDALEAAESAAFAFWSSLKAFREDMIATRTGEKRKRACSGPDPLMDELWNHMQAQEESCLPHRNATLQRWSRKAQAATALPERGVINKSANQPTIIEALQEHLSNRDRLLRRAHTPRSCAPLQLARRVAEDVKIYDDVDFYSLLLKELLEQRGADSVAAASVDLTSGVDLRRAAKTKKQVDTKASKGRKLRYTVHEKLQNFMAPEDRRMWSDRQADDLFGSLFGQRMVLGEIEEREELEDHGFDGSDGDLVLFRA